MIDEPKTVSIWDGAIQYHEPVPGVRTEEVKAAIEAGLAAFGQHKEELLKMLSDECASGPGLARSFDPDNAWRSLTRVAETHLWRRMIKQGAMPDAARRARLREIVKALKNSRNLVDAAMQDEVGDDLFDAWWNGNNETLAAGFYSAEEMFEQVLANLRTLETAAIRAADDAQPRPGRPKKTWFVPRGSIPVLADVFHNTTGGMPGAGDGPFARFVYAFLRVLGARSFTYDSLVDAIKDTLPHWRLSLSDK
jgi:hypothetical protein